jgi:hypothetical protein
MHMDMTVVANKMKDEVRRREFRGPDSSMVRKSANNGGGYLGYSSRYAEGNKLIFSAETGLYKIAITRDPSLDRCLHLSHWRSGDESGRLRMPYDFSAMEEILDAFFGPFKILLWVQPPTSQDGRALDLYQFRLFMDEDWRPNPLAMRTGHPMIPAEWISYPNLFATNYSNRR